MPLFILSFLLLGSRNPLTNHTNPDLSQTGQGCFAERTPQDSSSRAVAQNSGAEVTTLNISQSWLIKEKNTMSSCAGSATLWSALIQAILAS